MSTTYYLRGVIATYTVEVNFILNSLLTWNLWDSFFSLQMSSFLHEHLCSSHTICSFSREIRMMFVCVSVCAVWLMLPIYIWCFCCFSHFTTFRIKICRVNTYRLAVVCNKQTNLIGLQKRNKCSNSKIIIVFVRKKEITRVIQNVKIEWAAIPACAGIALLSDYSFWVTHWLLENSSPSFIFSH